MKLDYFEALNHQTASCSVWLKGISNSTFFCLLLSIKSFSCIRGDFCFYCDAPCTVLNCPVLWKGHIFPTKHWGIFTFQRKCLWHQIVSNQWCDGMCYAHLKSCTVTPYLSLCCRCPCLCLLMPLCRARWMPSVELHCFLSSSAPVENRGEGREMPRRAGWQEVIGANLRILQGKPLLLPAAAVSVCPGGRS